MGNIDEVNALLTAINFDRFAEIEARHSPDVSFISFRGPIISSSTAVEEWQRTFLRDYADCNYAETEYIEQDDTVVVRATIEAKGYDFRPFTQRIIEVFRLEGPEIKERHLYAMLRDVVLDKPATAALGQALEFPGGSVPQTKKLADEFYCALLKGDGDAAAACLDDKAVLIDSVYGVVQGPQAIIAQKSGLPRPMIGTERVVHSFAGAKDGCIELAIDPARPRLADWVRVVEGKIKVIESYWMLREIGVVETAGKRHPRQVIYPI